MNGNSGRAGRATRARFCRKRCLRVELARYDGAPVGQAVQVNTLPLSTSQTANACHSGALTEVAPKRKGE